MTIPKRTHEWENADEMVQPVTAGATSWDVLDSKEAGWGIGNLLDDAWKAVSGVGKTVGDLATGNIGAAERASQQVYNSGKDIGKTVINDAKTVDKAIGQAASGAWKWTKDHAGEIAMGAAALGATALAVGEFGLNPAADALAAGVDTTALGGAAVETAAAATTATETAAAATATEGAAATTATEGAATTATEGAGSAASDATSGVTKGMEIEPYKPLPAAASTAEEGAATDAAGAGSKIKDALGLLKDKGMGLAKGTAAISAGDTAANVINGPDMSGVEQQLQDLQKSMTPPPVTVTAPEPLRQIDLNPTTQGMGAPGAAPAAAAPIMPVAPPVQPVQTQAPMLDMQPYVPTPVGTVSSKLVDLIEEFGLHPEDIKRSLTTWQ